MFLYNRGYRGTLDGVTPHGVIITPSSIHAPAITRRDTYDSNIVLLDPQLYLMELNRNACEKAFMRLATYPWFTDCPPEFNSGEYGIREWTKNLSLDQCGNIGYPANDSELEDCILKCLKFQDENVDATHLIIPTPLAKTREDEFTEQLHWIKAGLRFKHQFSKPFLASIALSDNTMLHTPLEENVLLLTMLDALTTLDDVDGFYIVVERKDNAIHLADFDLCRALLEMSYVLSDNGNKEVFVNFADVFGAICLAVGATGFGGGYSNKEKRLNFDDFTEGFGIPLPRYFSLLLIADYYSQRDLVKIPTRRLRQWLEQERTAHSEPLFQAVMAGQSAENVPPWQERQNNVSAAARHRVQSLIVLADKISSAVNRWEKVDIAMDWLERAEERTAYLDRALHADPLTEDGRHISVWVRALESFLKDHP